MQQIASGPKNVNIMAKKESISQKTYGNDEMNYIFLRNNEKKHAILIYCEKL